MERIRDQNLVGILCALKGRSWGAGLLLTEHDRRLSVSSEESKNGSDAGPMRMLDVAVLPAGGTQVELMQDTLQLLLPATRQQIEVALLSLRIGRLFTGFRGRKVADLTAAVDAIMSIAGYAQANLHKLGELDVNPLLIRPADRSCSEMATDQYNAGSKGAGAVVVVALIRVSH